MDLSRHRLLSQLIFGAKRQGRPVQMLTSGTEFYSLTRQVLTLLSPLCSAILQRHAICLLLGTWQVAAGEKSRLSLAPQVCMVVQQGCTLAARSMQGTC